MFKRVFSRIMLAFFLISIFVVAFKIQPIRIGDANSTSVSLDPSSQTVSLGDSFTVNVSIADVSNLYGYQLELYYNSTLMNGTQVTEGPFLNESGGSRPYFQVMNFTDNYNSTYGIVYVVCTLTGSVPGVNGGGVLIKVQFKAVSQGNSVPLRPTDVELSNPNASPISHEDSDGTVTVAPKQAIYIRADGSISPSTAPIYSADNITYTLTGNITAAPDTNGIVIERDNIIVDGAGYTLLGSGRGNGTVLMNVSNVTVNDMTITNFTNGIYVTSSYDDTLSYNNITANNGDGLWLVSSSGNTLSGNNVTTNNGIGIWVFDSSSNNTLSANNIKANNIDGIELYSSSNSTVSGNNVANNSGTGIWLGSSSNNVLSGNNVTANNNGGIELDSSSDNTLSGNNVANNGARGILLYSSSDNTLSGNVMVGNEYNFGAFGTVFGTFGVYGTVFGDFLQSVDISNLVDGKPVYYFVNQSDIMVNPDAYPEVGYLGFVNCVNVTVQGMNLTNNIQGLLFAYTNDSEITGNNVTNNVWGIDLESSFNNTLSGNNVMANSEGIYLGSSSNDTLSGNNVTANIQDGIYLESSSGNTLSGNNVTSTSEFGIWLASSSDNFVFHNSFVNNTYQVFTEGLANIWDNGSTGNYWSDYLAKYPNATETGGSGIWNTPYVIDTNNIDHYPLMTQNTIPEFPSFLILPLFMITTLLLAILYKKNRHNSS